jgi:hypothetical protein
VGRVRRPGGNPGGRAAPRPCRLGFTPDKCRRRRWDNRSCTRYKRTSECVAGNCWPPRVCPSGRRKSPSRPRERSPNQKAFCAWSDLLGVSGGRGDRNSRCLRSPRGERQAQPGPHSTPIW